MLHHIPTLIRRWSRHHRQFISFIACNSVGSFAGSLAYGVLPVVIATSRGEWFAGIFISGFNLFQAFALSPIAGGLADIIGSKKTVLFGQVCGMLAAMVWILLPIDHLFTLLLFSFLLFWSYAFRNTAETYILRTVKSNEGGVAFGLFGNITSLSIFLSTASLPFFLLAGNQRLAPLALFSVYSLCFIAILFLPNDVTGKKKVSIVAKLNPLPSLRSGWNFLKKNNNYPALMLGASLFDGIFYGTIWFVFPLHIVALGLQEGGGMHLGVYDLVTALFAGYAGYLADKYNWRHVHSLGWIFVIVGLIALPFYGWPTWLIIVGFVIAIGNNLSYYAATHALQKYDIDHREDGAFISLRITVNSVGYALAPLMAGFLYSRFGFLISLSVNSFVCILLALAMIILTWQLENKERKRVRRK